MLAYVGLGGGLFSIVDLCELKELNSALYDFLIEGPRYIPRYSPKKTKQMKLEENALRIFQHFLALFVGLGAAFCLYAFLIKIGVFYYPSWLH